MEEILESAAKGFISVLRLVIFEIILFNLGRVSLLFITLGRYPKGIWLKKHETRIGLTGLLIIISILLVIGIFNNFT